jgi:hypothetical protein
VTHIAGEGVDSSALVVRYTYYGDANLDRIVNALDFSALASNFGGTSTFWCQGDFNFDGITNSLDFDQIALNWNLTLPSMAPASALGALVPEPANLLALALLTYPLKRARRLDR